jgi:hypothetical protein
MMKTPSILLVIISFLFPLILHSQGKPNFVGQWYEQKASGKQKHRSEAFSSRPSDFTRTKRYNLKGNINQLNSIMHTKPELVDLVIPYGDKTYTLNLAKVEIISEDFNVRTNNGVGNAEVGVQYRGIVDGNPEQIASLNLSPDDKSAYFSTGEGNFVITKEGTEYIVYNDQVMDLPVTIFCQTPSTSTPITFDQNLISGVGCKTVKVYFECDYAFYQSKGSNLTTITNYVTGFFNQVATLYANEDIAIQVSEIFVWTTPDPYTALTTAGAILTPFRTNRGTNYNGNIAHFLTTRNIGGGVAYVDALCNKAYAFGVSMVYGTFNAVPTYSWTINVVTHELGHTLGSPHTQSCTWSGGPIDNCVAPEGNCSPGPAPVNGGTIMSYCQTTSAGINFNNGFGNLPGNLIRSRVSNASCIPASSLATPPASLSATNITSSSATLNWAPAPSSASYTVQYKLSTASTWTSAGSTSSTSINITGLTANSNYTWSVKADCSAFAPEASFATTGSSSGCTAPTNLSTSNITQTGASMNWAAVTGATGYTVQYKTSAASTWTSVNATTTSINVSGLTANTSYVWQVKASCSPGYSTQVNFATTGTTGCAAPLNLNATNITSTGATLNWSAVQGATGYTVQYKAASASTWTSVNASSTSINISGLTANTSYVWQVKASCSPGYSTQVNFATTGTTGCAAPLNLNATNITSTGATLNWSAVQGATGYTVQYKTASASTWTSVNASSTSINISGLAANTSYVWKVKASCSPGYSTQVNFATTGTTGCAAPLNLNATNITSTGATLNWSAVQGATGYTLQYKSASASTWSIINTTTTSKAISGLVANTGYTWQVKASCSGYSTSSTFTTTGAVGTSGCTVPTNMNAINITSNSATLTWTGPSNGTSYTLNYRRIGFSGWTYISNITGNSRVISGLASRGNYEWSVRANCSNGMSSGSSGLKTFTTL